MRRFGVTALTPSGYKSWLRARRCIARNPALGCSTGPFSRRWAPPPNYGGNAAKPTLCLWRPTAPLTNFSVARRS